MSEIVFTEVSQKCKDCSDENQIYYMITDQYSFRVYGYFNYPVKESTEFCYIWKGEPCNTSCECGKGFTITKLNKEDIKWYIYDESYEEIENKTQDLNEEYSDCEEKTNDDSEEDIIVPIGYVSEWDVSRNVYITNNSFIEYHNHNYDINIDRKTCKSTEFNINHFKTTKTLGACTICLEKQIKGDDVCILQCCHMFHYQCIKQWMKYKKTCPLCRNNII